MNNCENITLRGLGCEFISGFAFKSSDYSNKGVPLIKIGNIQNRIVKIDLNGNFISTENIEDKYERYFLNHNDVLIAMTGQGSVGRVGRLKLDDEIKPFLNQRVGKFICNETDLNIDFLYYVLSSKKYQEILFNIGSGSGQPNLSPNAILNVEIPKISYQIQKRIADVLSALDDKIEINNKINENLEAQAQAIFKQWFVDFEFPDKEGKPYKSNGGKFIDSELGKIPEGWKVGSIYELVDVVYGAPYKSKLFNENKEGYPLIRIRDLKTFSPFYYTEEILPTTEYINEGDIIAGMDAEFTPCIWRGETGVLNQRVCKFKSNKVCISNLFIYFHIKPHLDFLQFHKVGTTVSHMGKSDIDRINVIIPNEVTCMKYSLISNQILSKILNNSSENRRLSELRDGLLPRLMSGEVRV